MIKVSVIFATHNRADILPAVFDAWREVDKVTKYSYEIICSDDESDDKTVDVLESVKDLPIKVLKNKKGGASRARNAALEVASGEVIIFTGDDIFPAPDFINRHYENYLKFGPEVASLGRLDWHPDIKVNYLMKHITEIGCEQFGFIALPVYQFIDFRHFYTSNISVSRKLLDTQKEYFSLDFDKYGFEDIELAYRLQKSGMRVYYDPDIFATHHHIYDSVDKFINRQISAGEELVVFDHLHDDLEGKCIINVKEIPKPFTEYMSKSHVMKDIRGHLIVVALKLLKWVAKRTEKSMEKKDSAFKQKVCSYCYFVIFQVMIRYGVVKRISEENNMGASDYQIYSFLYEYLKSPLQEIYFDIGRGYNEEDAKKWICYGNGYRKLTLDITDNMMHIRLAPLKNYCKAYIEYMQFVTEDGSKVNAEVSRINACHREGNCYDFSNTNDPEIIIDKIPKGATEFCCELRIERINRKGKCLRSMKTILGKLWRQARFNIGNSGHWNMEYSFGQKRMIQIGISGDIPNKAELIDMYCEQVAVLGDSVVVSDINNMKMGYSNYVYAPKEEPLDVTQMLQVAYALMDEVLDYVIVSKAFLDHPYIAGKNIADLLIYRTEIENIETSINTNVAQGRIMRLPGRNVENNRFDICDVYPGINIKEALVKGNNPVHRFSARSFGVRKGDKPMIFVVPVFLAVGGIERNTIEIMRKLKDKYDFCMITMEKHAEQQGSLHYQLEGLCDYVFDIREITEPANFLGTLYELKEMFHPSLIWMCNNFPWFEDHTRQIQKLFHDVPFVMQDVYDTKVGWIEYYDKKPVQDFDRYIAITELIRETFENKYSISKEKIDVIYPAVNDKHIKKVKAEALSYEEVCKKYGLAPEKEHYSFVARLAEQKKPLRYLKLVEDAIAKYGDKMQFVMVGDGVLRDEVDVYIKEHGLEDKLLRIPYMDNVPEFVQALDSLVITSDFEGMPIVSIESMSMGVPVFSTDSGDTRRFIEKYGCGKIIDDAKTDLENFEEYREHLEEYKAKAKQYSDEILDFFSVKNVSRLYYESFEKAMKGRK